MHRPGNRDPLPPPQPRHDLRDHGRRQIPLRGACASKVEHQARTLGFAPHEACVGDSACTDWRHAPDARRHVPDAVPPRASPHPPSRRVLRECSSDPDARYRAARNEPSFALPTGSGVRLEYADEHARTYRIRRGDGERTEILRPEHGAVLAVIAGTGVLSIEGTEQQLAAGSVSWIAPTTRCASATAERPCSSASWSSYDAERHDERAQCGLSR